jgi:hypothetical protein
MKRIGLLVGLLGAVLVIAGCDEVKRRATETGREVITHQLDVQQDKVKKAGDDAFKSDSDDSASKKRDKLKGDEDSEK